MYKKKKPHATDDRIRAKYASGMRLMFGMDGPGEERQQARTANNLESLFSVPLLADNIIKYVPTRDLRNLEETSKGINAPAQLESMRRFDCPIDRAPLIRIMVDQIPADQNPFADNGPESTGRKIREMAPRLIVVGRNMSPVQWNGLVALISEGCMLVGLRLNLEIFTPQMFSNFTVALGETNMVKYVHIQQIHTTSWIFFGDENITSLCDYLSRNTDLYKLTITSINLGNEGVRQIFESIANRTKTISELNICDTGISNEGLGSMTEELLHIIGKVQTICLDIDEEDEETEILNLDEMSEKDEELDEIAAQHSFDLRFVEMWDHLGILMLTDGFDTDIYANDIDREPRILVPPGQ